MPSPKLLLKVTVACFAAAVPLQEFGLEGHQAAVSPAEVLRTLGKSSEAWHKGLWRI